MSNKNSNLSSVTVHLEITGGFLIFCAVTGFFCGGESLLAAALAAAVHEWGHLAAMLRQNCIPSALRLDASGACLTCRGALPGYGQELRRALAGPLLGLAYAVSLASCGSDFLRTSARMSLLLSAVNLLPGEGLDGGRILNCLLMTRMEPVRAGRVRSAAEWASALVCFLAGLRRSPQLCLYGFWLLLRSAGIGD